MADYPTLPLEYRSRRRSLLSRAIAQTGDGDFSISQQSGAETFRFTAIHAHLTAAEAASLETFWDTYQASEFNLAWKDGVTYTAVFLDRPDIERESALYYRATAEMIGRA